MNLNRDPAFWTDVATHPQVAPAIHLGVNDIPSVEAFVAHEAVFPVSYEGGGFIFAQLDGLGLQFELHTLFKPEQWGKPVARAARDAFPRLFGMGAQIVTTYEQEDNWRSRPPKSHGWKVCGDFVSANMPTRVRMWYLTSEAWYASPVGRKVH